MIKKAAVFAVICVVLLIMTVPAMAVLKVLEPELSEELRGIAKSYLAETHSTEADAIIIEDGWVREYWNIKVDVYMVEAVIDKGLATEQRVQVPVRVDAKAVLADAELKALEEQDNSLASDEPQARILSVEEEKITPVMAEETPKPNNPAYIAMTVALVALLGGARLRVRRRAS